MSLEDYPQMLTPTLLAKLTGEHVGSIRRGIARGAIPADKVNGRWYIDRDVVFKNARRAKEGAVAEIIDSLRS